MLAGYSAICTQPQPGHSRYSNASRRPNIISRATMGGLLMAAPQMRQDFALMEKASVAIARILGGLSLVRMRKSARASYPFRMSSHGHRSGITGRGGHTVSSPPERTKSRLLDGGLELHCEPSPTL